MNLIYLSQGKLFLKVGDDPARELASQFGQEMFDRAVESHRLRAWKTKGRGNGFLRGGMLWGQEDFDPRVMRVRISAATRAAGPGELLYALDSGDVGGLFVVHWETKRERRLFHREDYAARDLARHPRLPLTAYAVHAANGTAHVALIDDGDSSGREVTEGDSLDEAPSWVPGEGRRLLFQSAGIGRDAEGLPVALGHAVIQSLDLDSGELTTVLEEDGADLLLPRADAEGNLYFIRRPYEPLGGRRRGLAQFLSDVLRFPFRLGEALYHFLDFFSVTFAKKPLTPAGGPKVKGADARTVMLRGRVLEVLEASRGASEREATALAPRDWRLVRRDKDGRETVLAERVAAFDLAPEGRLVYSTGGAVFELAADGSSSLVCRGDVIEHVAVVA